MKKIKKQKKTKKKQTNEQKNEKKNIKQANKQKDKTDKRVQETNIQTKEDITVQKRIFCSTFVFISNIFIL